jgi:hypothetical protein
MFNYVLPCKYKKHWKVDEMAYIVKKSDIGDFRKIIDDRDDIIQHAIK